MIRSSRIQTQLVQIITRNSPDAFTDQFLSSYGPAVTKTYTTTAQFLNGQLPTISSCNYLHCEAMCLTKVKVHIALYGLKTHHRATERHLPYGITVLPATRHRRTCPTLTPAMQASTWFTYPRGMEGWVDTSCFCMTNTVWQHHTQMSADTFGFCLTNTVFPN